MDTYSIQQKLQNVNLSKEEAIIYIWLLKLGQVSVTQLAKKSGYKRPTTYVYLKSLKEKSLINWITSSKGKLVSAVDPSHLTYQIDKLQDNLNQAKISFNEILPELNKIKSHKNYSTQVKYYKGAKELRQLINNTLNAQDKIIGYSCYGRNKIFGEKFMYQFRQKWVDNRLEDWVIINDKNKSLAKTYPKHVGVIKYLDFQKVRYLPAKKFYITSDIMIYNNVYAIANLDINNPIGVEIINEEIVKTEISIFNYMWQIAKPINWII